jgi:hypothetical protein
LKIVDLSPGFIASHPFTYVCPYQAKSQRKIRLLKRKGGKTIAQMAGCKARPHACCGFRTPGSEGDPRLVPAVSVKTGRAHPHLCAGIVNV